MKVKIRIAVAVHPDGSWNCAGWADAEDKEMMDLAIDPLEAGETRYYINAELEAIEPRDVSELDIQPA